jgi:cell division inhibitor SulA/protein ImuA
MQNNVVSLNQLSVNKPEALNQRPYEILSTGFAELDRLLPGASWPAAGITEIISAQGFIDPITLLLPTLATLSNQQRWLTWVMPPRLPTLKDLSEHGVDTGKVLLIHPHHEKTQVQLTEQALATGCSSTVLAWLEHVDNCQLQRLAKAAITGNTTAFLFRPAKAERQISEADLRVFVSTHTQRLEVEILQCRGGAGSSLQLPSHSTKPLFTPDYYCRRQVVAAG